MKSNKPENKVVRLWTQDSKDELGACFDCTDWEVLREGTLDEICTVTTDYINFCVQSVIPTKTIKVYPNNKTYITKDIKQTMNLRKVAFKNKDTMELQKRDKELRGKLREARETLGGGFQGWQPQENVRDHEKYDWYAKQTPQLICD